MCGYIHVNDDLLCLPQGMRVAAWEELCELTVVGQGALNTVSLHHSFFIPRCCEKCLDTYQSVGLFDDNWVFHSHKSSETNVNG